MNLCQEGICIGATLMNLLAPVREHTNLFPFPHHPTPHHASFAKPLRLCTQRQMLAYEGKCWDVDLGNLLNYRIV